jgi:hypothetical protein
MGESDAGVSLLWRGCRQGTTVLFAPTGKRILEIRQKRPNGVAKNKADNSLV